MRLCSPSCRAAAIIGFVGAWFGMTTPGIASEYACKVPRALLCADCATQIGISLLPGGGCRISFIPSAVAGPAPPNLGSDQLEFKIEAPRVVVSRAFPRWSESFRRAHPTIIAKVMPIPHCFVFNGSKYCE